MKYDLIDLQGIFSINGSTGYNGAALGMSGSDVEWITNSGTSEFKNSGYNYFIVGATGTPTENAQGLIDVNNNIYWSGSPATDNRYTILLMPGEYDLAGTTSEQIVVQSYVNYVGISKNPYDTTVRNSNLGWVFRDSGAINWCLENVYLPGDGRCYSDSGSYVRWKNIVVGGITFDDVTNSWVEINGEFEDIVVENGANFAHTTGSIVGRFNNIKGGSVNSFFSSVGIISVDMKNVFVKHIQSQSFSGNTINGTFENINIPFALSSPPYLQACFVADTINADFKNITLGPIGECFKFSTSLGGRYEKIELKTFGSAFFEDGINPNTTISGIFRDIRLGKGTDVFKASYLQIDLDNLFAENVSNIFKADINSTIRNVNVLKSTKTFESYQNLYGTFSNLILNTSDKSFYAAGDICVRINNSKASGGFLESIGSMKCEIQNVDLQTDILQTVLVADGDLNCRILNMNIGDVSQVFKSLNGSINGTVSNFYCGRVDTEALTTNFDLSGIFYNCNFGDVSLDFIRTNNEGPSAIFDKITVGDVGGNLFTDQIQIINSNVHDLKAGNVTANAFTSPSLNSANNLFEKITLGNVGGDLFCANDVDLGKINGRYQDIRALNVGNNFFHASQDAVTDVTVISGIFRDIRIDTALKVFCTESVGAVILKIDNSWFENITIGSCSNIFDGYIQENVKIRNLNVDSKWEHKVFKGSLENSFIDQRNKGGTFSLEGEIEALIKRSTILRKIGEPFIPSENVYLSSFNYIVGTPSGFTSSNYNLTDVLLG